MELSCVVDEGGKFFHRLSNINAWRNIHENEILMQFCVISDFRHEISEDCALLGYDAASNSNFLPTFRDYLSAPSSKVNILTLENIAVELYFTPC
jgi:hypothetical protein